LVTVFVGHVTSEQLAELVADDGAGDVTVKKDVDACLCRLLRP
jgi:hypothetical protein